MKSRFKTVFFSTLLLVSVAIPEAVAQWVQSCRFADTAYFLFAASPRLERYSLTNNQWLSPIALPSTYGLPSKFRVDADGIYVAYNQTVKMYDLSGANERHILNLAQPVQDIFTDGNLILINNTSYLYARFTSINKTDLTLIATFENYVDSVYGAAIAPGINKIFGRSQGISPADITYVSYNDNGTFIAGGDSPHHGDYPGANRVWVFPDEAKVVDDSGTVYNTGNLTYLTSFGGTINDLDFYGPDIPIVLRGSDLIAYSNSLLPLGSRSLPYTPANIYISGSNVITFTYDLSYQNGVRTDPIPLSTLNSPTPGQPVNPEGLAYTPDAVFVDTNLVVHLFCKAQQSIFRWDTREQKYLATLPLLGVPSYAAYSPVNHAIYLAYPSGLIRAMNLNTNTPVEVPFATLATAPRGLATADAFVFAMDASGAWGTHYTFSPSGSLVSSKDWNYYSTEYIWCSPNQKMYFFRDDTSPNDLLWEQISNGIIGNYQDSPLHDSTGFVHPIRVAPDGSIVVLGSGVIHDANTLARLTISLANSIDDAAWVTNQLRTIRNISGLTQLQQWTGPNYALGKVRQLPGTPLKLIAFKPDQMLAITLLGGAPSFYVLDPDFNVVAPTILSPPQHLRAQVVSTSQVNLIWDDVSGEETYSVERKTGVSGSWSGLGTAPTSSTNFVDSSVANGFVYFYRLIARNGTQASVPSAEVAAALIAPLVPANFRVTSTSSNSVSFAWDDVQYESSYQLERRSANNSTWTAATLAPDTIAYTDNGVTPYTSYFYRLRALNGIGISSYTAELSVTTDIVPPTLPTLTSANATGPFSIQLAWSNASYEDAYLLDRRDLTNTAWANIAVLGPDILTFLDTNVVPLTTYEYRISATNRLATSGYSGSRSVTTPQVPPPAAPGGLAARAISRSAILVTWSDVAYETGYRLERRLETPGSWALLTLLPANTTSFTDTNVIEGTQYFYRVLASNSYGNSLYSNEADATPVNIITLLADDFDPALDPTVWSSISGGVATNGGAGFRGSNALWFGAAGLRSGTLIPVNVSQGGTLQFLIRAGNEAVDGTAFWNNCEAGENVTLEYSKDNGASWTLIQTLNTVFPSLSSWTTFSVSLPTGAWGSHTQIRWRQLANSGAGFDTWALENVSLQAIAPSVPSAPPFIISSANSSTAIAILWIGVDGASSYVIERRDSAGSWMTLASVASTITYYTDNTAVPDTAYSYRVQAVNASGASPYSSSTTCVTWSQRQEWIYANYGSLDAMTEQQMETPGPDGRVPLLRFAFNLSASEPWRICTGNSVSGAPGIWVQGGSNKLHVQFVRRKAASNPGISYLVQFGSEPGALNTSGLLVEVVSIDNIWERVIYEDTFGTSQAAARYCRVAIQPQ